MTKIIYKNMTTEESVTPRVSLVPGEVTFLDGHITEVGVAIRAGNGETEYSTIHPLTLKKTRLKLYDTLDNIRLFDEIGEH